MKRSAAVAVAGLLVSGILAGTLLLRTDTLALAPARRMVANAAGSVVTLAADGTLHRLDLGAGGDVAPTPLPPPPSPPDALVLRADGRVLVLCRDESSARLLPWPPAADDPPPLDLAHPDVRLRAHGALEDGALEPEAPLYALLGDGLGAALLRIDPSTLAVTARAGDDALAGAVVEVSRGPGGKAVAVIAGVAAGNGGGRERYELRLLDEDLRVTHVVEGVAPVAPCWLPESGSLLYERAAGGLARFHPPEGKGVWLCDGGFPREAARTHVALRPAQEPFVLVEKLDKEGFVQVVRIFPFASGDAPRTKNITTGRVHKFGVAASAGHRYVAFRQVEGPLGEAAAEERVVLVDQEGGYASSTVVERRVSPTAVGVGPLLLPGEAGEDGAVVWIDGDWLWLRR